MKMFTWIISLISLLALSGTILAQDYEDLAPITTGNSKDVKLVKTLRDVGVIGRMAWSPDGTKLAFTGSDVWIYEPEADNLTLLLEMNAAGITFSPDGSLLAVGGGSRDPVIRLIDVESNEEVTVLSGHDDGVTGLAFSPDGTLLASVSRERTSTVKLWDVESGEQVRMFEVSTLDGIFSVAFSPNGNFLAFDAYQFDLASGRREAQAILVDLTTDTQRILNVGRGGGQPQNVLFSHDDQWLVMDSIQSLDNHSAVVWNVQTGALVRTITTPGGVNESNTSSIALSPDSSLLVTGHWNGSIRFHDLQGNLLNILDSVHDRWIYSVVFNPQGTMFASGGNDRTVKLWGTTVQSEISTEAQVDEEIQTDGDLECTVSTTNTVNLRSGPGTNFSLAGTLQGGVVLTVVGQASGSDGFVWWQLENGQYVREDIVVENGDCTSVPASQ